MLLLTKGPSEVDRRDDAVELSREFALALTTHDYRDLDASLEVVRRFAVGSFLEEFEDRMDSPEARAVLGEAESRARGSIVEGPLVTDFEGNRARTFTVVRQRVATKEQPEPQERIVRVELLMVDTDDGWRVDAVEVT